MRSQQTLRDQGLRIRRGFALLAAGGVVLTALILPLFALAQQGQGPSGLDQPFPARTLPELTDAIFRFGIIIVVLAASIYIAIGAYMYLFAAGNAELARAGKEYITRSIMGLVLGLLAWVILNTISPQFTELPNPQPPVRN